MWKYRWLVLFLIAVVTTLALLYAFFSPASHQAVATLVVEDPRASALFDVGNVQNPQRYVADQAAILESTVVAETSAQATPSLTSAEEVFEGLEVFWDSNSNQIDVVFTADTPEAAVAGANAVVAAYGEVRQEASSRDLEAALVQLDQSIDEVETRITDLQTRIEDLVRGDPTRQSLDRQLEEGLARLVELQDELPGASGERLEELRAELDDITQQLQTLQAIRSLDEESPRLAALLQEQSETIARKSDLLQRKDELSVEARTASDGIVLSSPALAALEVGVDPARMGALGLVLGSLVAAAAAYLLALRRRTFEDRNQPELVLGAPLLAEVPNFREERIRRELPVRHSPASASAEAFRFVSAALDIETEIEGATATVATHLAKPGAHLARSFIVVSPGLGDGKSVVAANTALASARQGKKVLAVDADFGYQRLTALLIGEQKEQPVGITNLVEASTPFHYVVQRVPTDEVAHLDLISRGTIPVTAPDFFRSAGVREFFDAVREEYDLVVIDSPPMLRVAYSSLLVRYADRTIAVVPHNSLVSQTEELADRLDYLETDLMGYVYNRAPLRDEMTASYGSLEDVVGARTQKRR